MDFLSYSKYAWNNFVGFSNPSLKISRVFATKKHGPVGWPCIGSFTWSSSNCAAGFFLETRWKSFTRWFQPNSIGVYIPIYNKEFPIKGVITISNTRSLGHRWCFHQLGRWNASLEWFLGTCGWNIQFLLGRPIFKWHISLRECIFFHMWLCSKFRGCTWLVQRWAAGGVFVCF